MRPDGARVAGVRIQGTVVRREWHQVRRERAGYGELVGEWVSDTVARCTVTTAASAPAPCRFTPPAGGTYTVTIHARAMPRAARSRPASTAGRSARTGCRGTTRASSRWTWSPTGRATRPATPPRCCSPRRSPTPRPGSRSSARACSSSAGCASRAGPRRSSCPSPRRSRPTPSSRSSWRGAGALRRARWTTPAVQRSGSGYAELRVTPERKRLAVSVAPMATEYRPGDTARVALGVRDAAGKGQRSEVTLWAVDEGVLALTGYRTPDPLDLLYRPRGLGMRLASTLTTVAPQVPEGEKGSARPGGGGGADAADILRSRFQTTAFFLGSVVTDAQGRATATARLPGQSHDVPSDGRRGDRRRIATAKASRRCWSPVRWWRGRRCPASSGRATGSPPAWWSTAANRRCSQGHGGGERDGCRASRAEHPERDARARPGPGGAVRLRRPARRQRVVPLRCVSGGRRGRGRSSSSDPTQLSPARFHRGRCAARHGQRRSDPAGRTSILRARGSRSAWAPPRWR